MQQEASEVVDLSIDSPRTAEKEKAAAAAAACSAAACPDAGAASGSGARSLWGELDEPPPRWRQVRRRSSQAGAREEALPPMPAYAPPQPSRAATRSSSLGRARAGGGGGGSAASYGGEAEADLEAGFRAQARARMWLEGAALPGDREGVRGRLARFRLGEPWPEPLGAAALAAWREELAPLLPLMREGLALGYFSLDEVREATRRVHYAQRTPDDAAHRAFSSLSARLAEVGAARGGRPQGSGGSGGGSDAAAAAAGAVPEAPYPPLSHLPPPPARQRLPTARRSGRGAGGAAAAAASSAVADIFMGLFAQDGALAGMQLGGLEGAAGARLAAIRDAFAGMNSGRLPPHMLFSDRDFDANDYEALLALDDAVQSKGADTHAIERVPIAVVGAGGVPPEKDVRCPICLEELVPGAVLRCLPCSHHFHRDCLDKWLAMKATCPICQQSL